MASEPTAALVPRAPGPVATGWRPRRAPGPGRPSCTGRSPSMFWLVSIGGPAAPDRYPPRSRRHPEDPRAPGPRPLGAESRPRPTHARRRRAL